jgi:hypothetical protein
MSRHRAAHGKAGASDAGPGWLGTQPRSASQGRTRLPPRVAWQSDSCCEGILTMHFTVDTALGIAGVIVALVAIAMAAQPFVQGIWGTPALEINFTGGRYKVHPDVLYQIPLIRTRGPIGAVRWT